MNTVAKLFIDRQEWELLSTKITYSRKTWANGKPCTEPMGGIVTLSFEPRGDEDDILSWAIADRMDDDSVEYPKCLYVLKKAEIVFYEGDYNGIILFKYRLEDCTCVYFSETFSNLWGMTTTIVLSAAIQYYKNSDTFYIKQWRENWKPPTEYKPSVEEDKTPKITEIYYTNLKGERINLCGIEEYVYLVIEGRNIQGKTITLNLNDPNVDFKYNGVYLKNDTIEEYIMKSDIDKIKLNVIKQQ